MARRTARAAFGLALAVLVLLGVAPAQAIDLSAEIDRFYEATDSGELDAVARRTPMLSRGGRFSSWTASTALCGRSIC